MHCRMGASLQNIFRRIYNRRCWHFRIIWMVCLENWYRGSAEPTVQIAGHVAKSIPNLLVNMVIIILSSYLFLADRESIMRWLK